LVASRSQVPANDERPTTNDMFLGSGIFELL
jgi:hypothetical protein